MGKRHSEEIKRKALECFRQDFGEAATAKELGISIHTVSNWYYKYRAGNFEWVTNSYMRTDPVLLGKIVQEYISTGIGLPQLTLRYGIAASTILRGYRNYLNYGIVTLPRGRYAMEKLSKQKQALVEKIKEVDDGNLLSKKEVKELHDLLVVNISLIEVILGIDCPEIEKKKLRLQKDQLEKRLAYVKRVLSSN